MADKDLAKWVFGDFVIPYLDIVDGVANRRGQFHYDFMPEPDYLPLLQKDKGEAMKVYWLETIYRAHLASTTSILRHKEWVEGILASVKSNNYFAFAACLRGLMESAADTYHALGTIPTTLASSYPTIRSAISGKLSDRIFISKELEDILIHFSYARRLSKGESAPQSHKAKTTAEYLSMIEAAENGVLRECYAHLCEVTHPVAFSVFFFLDIDDSGNRFRYHPDPDTFNIGGFVPMYRSLMPSLFNVSLNPAMLILRFVNHLDIPGLDVPFLNHVSMEGIPLWQKMKKQMNI